MIRQTRYAYQLWASGCGLAGEKHMTFAICLQCGKEKFGAFTVCEHCGFTPTSSQDRAKSVSLSDHERTRVELSVLSAAIESGQPVVYDPKALAKCERVLDALLSDPEALQCTECGEDIDSFEDSICPSCRLLGFG